MSIDLEDYFIPVRYLMNRFSYILPVLLTLTSSTAVFSQDNRPNLKPIEKAFSTGDVAALTALSADRVEIAVFGRSRLYSRSQARFVLKDLFSQYPPQRFQFSEPSRTSKGLFAVGSYRYALEDDPLKVYVRLRKDGDGWVLREILVEKPVR